MYTLGGDYETLFYSSTDNAPSDFQIDAFSSAEDRSTHSLLCLLASLYAPSEEWQFLPGFKWQPIPVSYLDSDDIVSNITANIVHMRYKRK